MTTNKVYSDNYRIVALWFTSYFVGYKPKEKIKQIRKWLTNEEETKQLLGEEFVEQMINYQNAWVDFMEKWYRPEVLDCPYKWIKSFLDNVDEHLAEILSFASHRETLWINSCVNGPYNNETSVDMLRDELERLIGKTSKADFKDIDKDIEEKEERFTVNNLDWT